MCEASWDYKLSLNYASRSAPTAFLRPYEAPLEIRDFDKIAEKNSMIYFSPEVVKQPSSILLRLYRGGVVALSRGMPRIGETNKLRRQWVRRQFITYTREGGEATTGPTIRPNIRPPALIVLTLWCVTLIQIAVLCVSVPLPKSQHRHEDPTSDNPSFGRIYEGSSEVLLFLT